MKKYTDDEIIEIFKTFPKDKYSLIVSSSNNENDPLTSYSPFIEFEDKFYIVMSSSMPHYKNIETSKKAHIFIIEDEKDAFHIFARKRLYFSAVCKVVEKERFYNHFEKRFSDSLSFIKEMDDFVIIELTPKDKSLVLGFGAAYIMNENKELKQKSISHK